MPDVVNIAGYKFVPLANLKALRDQLREKSRALDLRGTILLSAEGINVFVAGAHNAVDELLAVLRSVAGLADFSPKRSISDDHPFNRMLIKIKREIIAFGVPGIEPHQRTTPKLAPQELKRWLDEGRSITLLDTRNQYEVKLGTFENAVALDLDHFRNFPQAMERLPRGLKERPIVMFCTGGIRCEKAGPYMEREGFRNVFQLEGGILKYFEECGNAHYSGDCFVFDRRIGLDPSLAETNSTQCFNCQATLSPADQADSRYVEGRSCPHCYLSEDERLHRKIIQREHAIARVSTPLPGSTPYDNIRPINIAAQHQGKTLLETLRSIFSHLPADYWPERFSAGLVLNSDYKSAMPDQRVRAGERYLHRTPFTSEPDVNAAIRILHEDEAIVVVNKPAPLPIHPCGRFNRNSLQWILSEVYHPQKLRPIHRLDANTTGLVVLARTRHFAGRLQPQFVTGDVEKLYMARIKGHPRPDEFICDAAMATTAIGLGAREIDGDGANARTEFRVLQRLRDGTSLVAARPITGRTNQIRVHLWHLGWPIVGDQAYLPNQQLGDTQTHTIGAPPLCLHAQRIAFFHPQTKERVTFECPPPAWFELAAEANR